MVLSTSSKVGDHPKKNYYPAKTFSEPSEIHWTKFLFLCIDVYFQIIMKHFKMLSVETKIAALFINDS